MPVPAVTVVVATHERSESCRTAVASALAQDPPPLEVLICDDGSGAAAEDSLRALAAEHQQVRYLRIDPGAGTPAPARNLGIDQARGDWVAFLDDDDEWLPGKLAAQTLLIETAACDIVASDAVTTSGGRYFGARDGPLWPTGAMIARANPIIVSTAVVRKSTLQDVGGFNTERWIGGVADYDLWLRLSARGARFVIVDKALAIYDDTGPARMSAALLRMQVRLARLKWRRVRASPLDRGVLRSAVFESLHAVSVLVRRVREGASPR